MKLYLLLLPVLISGCKILSLSGGGSYGAFEAGIVSHLIEDNKGGWDLITGVSAGSINSAYFSTIAVEDEDKYVDLYKELWVNLNSSAVYSYEFFINGLSVFNTKPLKKTLTNIFQNKKPIRPVIISATSLKTSKATIFDNKDIHKYGYVDILLSSAAIPVLFNPHEFLDDIFVDGGLTSNVILNEGINYCLDNFPEEKIFIDVILCGHVLDPDSDIKLNLIEILERLLYIIKQQVEYSEIIDNIHFPKHNIVVNLYEQNISSDISMLDFSQGNELWNQGYTFSNVKITYDIFN